MTVFLFVLIQKRVMAHFTDDVLGLMRVMYGMRVTCPLLAAESKQKQKIISSHSSCFANLFALFNSTTHEAIWKTGQNFLPFIHCFLRIQKSIFAYISVKQHRNKTNKKRNCWHSGWVGIVCVWQVWLYSSSFYASQKCNKEASFQKAFTSWAMPQRQGQGTEGLSEKEVSLLGFRNEERTGWSVIRWTFKTKSFGF